MAIIFPLTTCSCSYSLSLKCAHGPPELRKNTPHRYFDLPGGVSAVCRSMALLKDASVTSGTRKRWSDAATILSVSLDIFISFHGSQNGGKAEKNIPLSELAHCRLLIDRQNVFVSWTKLEFPSSLHLAQIETTLKAISLHFPEERLQRDDICLLFILCLMWNFIKINCLFFFSQVKDKSSLNYTLT